MRTFPVLTALALSLVSCRKSDSAEPQPERAAAAPQGVTPQAVSAASAAPAALTPVVDEAPFHLELSAPSQVKPGEAFVVSLKLTAQNGYKVNQEYPIKLALEGAGLTFEPSVLRKEQLTLEDKKAELKGKATASAPGALNIVGKLSFSVCTEERCLIEKRDLSVSVTSG